MISPLHPQPAQPQPGEHGELMDRRRDVRRFTYRRLRRYLNVARGGYKMAPFSNPPPLPLQVSLQGSRAEARERPPIQARSTLRRLQARYTNWFLPISTTSTHTNSWFRASVNRIVSQVELLQVSSHLFCWILRLIRSRIL